MQMKHIMKIKKDNKKVHFDVQVSSESLCIKEFMSPLPR